MSIELIKIHDGTETVIDANSTFSVVPGDRLMLQNAELGGIISILVRTDGAANILMLNGDVRFPIDLGEAEQYIPKLFVTVTTSDNRTRTTYEIKQAPESTVEAKEIPDPIPSPIPQSSPAMETESLKKIAELEQQLEQVAKERDGAAERLKKAEEELDILHKAVELQGTIEEQQTLIGQWRKKLDELQNEEYRIRSFELADAQEQLTERKAQIAKAKEELNSAEKELAEQTQILEEQKAKLTHNRLLLTSQHEELQTVEQELKSLQNRHCDAQRAKTELEQKRRDLGLMDDEMQACEDEIKRVSQALTVSQEQLADISNREKACQEEKNKLETQYRCIMDEMEALEDKRTSIDGEIKKYESEINAMEGLRKQRAKEWEQLLRNFSALLSTVIKEKFDLDETYNLLIKAMDSKLVENMAAEATEQRAMLDDCGTMLAKVSKWIGEVKSRKAL